MLGWSFTIFPENYSGSRFLTQRVQKRPQKTSRSGPIGVLGASGRPISARIGDSSRDRPSPSVTAARSRRGRGWHDSSPQSRASSAVDLAVIQLVDVGNRLRETPLLLVWNGSKYRSIVISTFGSRSTAAASVFAAHRSDNACSYETCSLYSARCSAS